MWHVLVCKHLCNCICNSKTPISTHTHTHSPTHEHRVTQTNKIQDMWLGYFITTKGSWQRIYLSKAFGIYLQNSKFHFCQRVVGDGWEVRCVEIVLQRILINCFNYGLKLFERCTKHLLRLGIGWCCCCKKMYIQFRENSIRGN